MSTAKPEPTVGKHPLLGAGLHWKDDVGRIERQAEITAVFPSGHRRVGHIALIQYFSWIMGERTTRQLVPVTRLTDTQWVLYASVADMNDYYNTIGERRNEQIDKAIARSERETEQ